MSRTDTPQAIWARDGLTIRPANDVASAMLLSIKDGNQFIGKFRGVRSIKQLRLWWGLMAILVDHDIFPLQEAASRAVKIACGFTEFTILPDTGEVYYSPKSIAFESLKQHEFNEVMRAAINVICRRWLEGVNSDDLRKEVWRALDPPGAQGERIR
jgi:hypothetical protein